MKTNVKPKPLRLCESTFFEQSSSRGYWQQLYGRVSRKISNLLNAARAALTGLRVQVTDTLNTNNHLYYGLIICVVVSPIANEFYHAFDPKANTPYQPGDWFYVNWYYYLFSVGEQLSKIFFLIGSYIIFSPYITRWFFQLSFILAGVYPVTKVIWVSSAQSNEQFHSAVPVYVFLVGAGFLYTLSTAIEWFVARKYHKYDGIKADHTLISQQLEELEHFQSRY